MKVVALVSGGLDSTVMSVLLKKEKAELIPVFIDYGQRARAREWYACRRVHANLGLPQPKKIDLRGIGGAIKSGLTDKKLDVFLDAFLPGRNLYFLTVASSIAVERNADAVAIGLLAERTAEFPDQSDQFLASTEHTLSVAMGRSIKLLTPLRDLVKEEVVRLARSMRVKHTYSCHMGGRAPCGRCIACREYESRR